MMEDKKIHIDALDSVSGGTGNPWDGHIGTRIEKAALGNYIGERFIIADIEDNYDPDEGYLRSISEDGSRAYFEHSSPRYMMSYPLGRDTDIYYLYK